jgi:hypothetical protein
MVIVGHSYVGFLATLLTFLPTLVATSLGAGSGKTSEQPTPGQRDCSEH